MKRKAVGKRKRFETFKRDKFTCQYCGRKAPDVVLMVVDHIHPASKGGTNDILNLITSCTDCNAGKSDKLLSDNAVIERQHAQLSELQERREQLEMLFKWKNELLDLEEEAVRQVAALWSREVPGQQLTDAGIASLRKLIKTYSAGPVADAMHDAVVQKVVCEDGKPTQESAIDAWTYIPRICRFRANNGNDEDLRRLFYIRAIVRNNMYLKGYEQPEALALLRRARAAGADLEDLRSLATTARNKHAWFDEMERVCTDLESVGGCKP